MVCGAPQVEVVKLSDAGLTVTSGSLLLTATVTVPDGCCVNRAVNVPVPASAISMASSDSCTLFLSLSNTVTFTVDDATLA